MIDQLITALSKEVEMSAEEIADTIWLALQMQEFQAESVSSGFPLNKEDERGINKQESQSEQGILPKTSELGETPTPSPEERKAGIYPRNQQHTSKSLDLSFKVPDARSLREPLTLARALKPLMRRIPSGRELVLDEAATIQRIADEGLWIPVLRPTVEPWLDLELVVDEAISMQIWRHTIRELERLLKNYGIFRDVRVWGLITDENEQVQIRRGIGATARSQTPRSPKELIDPSGRRLVLLVSDCVSSLWRNGAVTPVLELWAKQGSMAIVQMLPKWLWKRTALGRASEVRLRGLTPGMSNQKLIAKEVSLWDELEEEKGVKVPVFTLEADKVVTWAQMLSGKGGIWTLGYVFKLDATPVNKDNGLFNLAHSDLSAEQRVQAFRVTASPMARKLAGLLASAPVISLPIVRLIQETLLKDSQQVHVAEVFLGGLLKPLTEINADTNPDYAQYEFMDEVRELLVDSVPSNYVFNVVDVVSKYVSRKVGLSLENFAAVLRNQQEVKDSKITKEIKYFATVTAQVLRRLSGKYTQLAEDLEKFSKKYWLFQGNPKIYRMFDAIKDLKGMPWPSNRYTEELSVGDEVLIWVSGKESGIYAFGEIIEPVKIFEEVYDIDYWINTDMMSNLRTQPGPYIRFTTKLLDQPLLRKELKQDSILKDLSVIRINRGSIFKVKPEQWKRVHELRSLGIKSQKSSKLGIDYNKLSNLLTSGKWKEADEETFRIMLKATNREKERTLDYQAIKNVPCRDLNTIDKLWINASKGRFGFSIQLKKWQEAGGKANKKTEYKLGNDIGWYVNNKWLSDIAEFTFDLAAPVGHLPVEWTFHLGGIFPRTEESVLFADFANRLLECNINNLEIGSQITQSKIETYLQKFEFETVTVNHQGEIIKTETKQAQYFVEKLPDNKSLEMIAIPGGKFMMGSPDGEGNDREKPQHEVTVQSFFMGKYPVTQAQWRAVINLPRVNWDLNHDPSNYKGDNRPVERVSWDEAVEFCDRLSKYTGRQYRLPSESEWEYACRAGTSTPFCFGETLTPNLAIYGSNRGKWHSIDYNYINPISRPIFVNNFGLFDMHGTVWEWCADSLHNNYEDAPIDGSIWIDQNYKQKTVQSKFIVRGGSWGKLLEYCRSAYRQSEKSDYKSEYNGFRVVCITEINNI